MTSNNLINPATSKDTLAALRSAAPDADANVAGLVAVASDHEGRLAVLEANLQTFISAGFDPIALQAEIDQNNAQQQLAQGDGAGIGPIKSVVI